jgi:hypothetical protein
MEVKDYVMQDGDVVEFRFGSTSSPQADRIAVEVRVGS